MGRTSEPAWRNTDPSPFLKSKVTRKQQAKPKLKSYTRRIRPQDRIRKNTGKTKERAWGNIDTPKKKVKPTRKFLGDDSDVEIIDLEEYQLVENVSSMSDFIGKNMFKTKEHACRNTDTSKKKLKQTQEILNDSDIELLDPQQEFVENVSLVSASLEKLSSSPESGMIRVQGYKVKQSNAPILESIFKKHGDIAAECVFKTNSVRSSILDVVCEVVRRIQTNNVIEKMEEIECQVSDAQAANINVSWLQAHLEDIHRRKDYNLLMEMKSNTILVRTAAQMDLRERCEALVAAQQRFYNAERCVRVLNLVEKNLNDNILESKAKIDSWINQPVV